MARRRWRRLADAVMSGSLNGAGVIIDLQSAAERLSFP